MNQEGEGMPMSLDLRNCKSCGRAYQYDGVTLCTRCRKNSDEAYAKVKEYLYDNPGASVGEVSEATEVNEKTILKFLREGRLEIKDENNMFLDCERCSVPIKSGRYCDKCTHEMTNEFRSAVTPKEKEKPKEVVKTKQSQRMHVNVKRKK